MLSSPTAESFESLSRVLCSEAVENLQLASAQIGADCIKHGAYLSSMHIQRLDGAAVNALRVGARKLYELLMRVHGAEPTDKAAERAAHLQKLYAKHLEQFGGQILATRDDRLNPILLKFGGNIAVGETDKAIATSQVQYAAEIQIAVATLVNTGSFPLPAASTINVAGSVGAIHTGANSISNMGSMTVGSDVGALAIAFETLLSAVRQSQVLDAQSRPEVVEILEELKRESAKPTPNRSRVGGLLSGVATAVQTIPNVTPAWIQILAWYDALCLAAKAARL